MPVRNFQSNRSSVKKHLYSLPAIFLLFLAVFFLGRAAFKSYSGARGVYGVYAEVRAERQELLGKKSELERRLAYLSTPKGLEKELRREFGLVIPGESLVTIITRENPNVIPEVGTLSSFLSGIKNFFTDFYNKDR